MKKNTIKAFTLVEMLIVIVIIGILIASLMPRMQTAQGRARDVARKNDLSQIQTAIITSQSDRKEWPGRTNCDSTTKICDNNKGMLIKDIWPQLKDAWMTSIPEDPNGSNANYWIWSSKLADDRANDWQYLYMVAKRNWVKDAWFVLMAKTEVEWSSNWVVCEDAGSSDKELLKNKWYIISTDDLKDLKLCNTVKKDDAQNPSCRVEPSTNTCYYTKTWQLRYVLAY